MAMTVARRAASGPARSAKSPPLKRPPRITTSPSPKLSMARRAASMFVAFESFTNCTPAMSVTGSSACSSPVNPSTAGGHRRRLHAGNVRHRRSGHHVDEQVAAEQPDRRQRHQRLRGRPAGDADDRAARRARCRRPAARSSTASAAAHARRARCASDAGSSALSTAQSAADWFSKIRALAAAYSSTVAWRSRWSGEKFSSTAIQG